MFVLFCSKVILWEFCNARTFRLSTVVSLFFGISRDLFIGDDLTVTDDLTVGNDTYLGNNVSTDVVTISGSILQTGSINLEGKLQIDIKNLSLDDIFLIKSASIDAVSVNNQGVFVLGEMETPPTPVAGGIFYSSSAFFMGIG